MEEIECWEIHHQKTVRGAVDAPPRKTNIRDSNEQQVKTTSEICVSIGTSPKEHPSEPIEGNTPKSRRCQQRCGRKLEREEISALQKRIDVDQADLKNRQRQIARSVQEKVRESYGFLPDER